MSLGLNGSDVSRRRSDKGQLIIFNMVFITVILNGPKDAVVRVIFHIVQTQKDNSGSTQRRSVR